MSDTSTPADPTPGIPDPTPGPVNPGPTPPELPQMDPPFGVLRNEPSRPLAQIDAPQEAPVSPSGSLHRIQ